MYFPKTQIVENLKTEIGEFVLADTKEPYNGFYFKTSDNRFYTGKNYQAGQNYLLEILSPGTSTQTQSEIAAETKPESYYIIDDAYYYSKGYDINRESPVGPVPSIPQPTINDYKIGEFMRYFLRKPNENYIIEVDKKQYNLFSNRDESVQWKSYQPLLISWMLTGKSSKDVGDINFNLASLQEFQNSAFGFVSYFKGKFNQYYRSNIVENLTTDGTEFKNKRTGENYVGSYHIHPTKGPMVGAKHINSPHDYLIPIEELQAISTAPTGSVQGSGGYSGGY